MQVSVCDVEDEATCGRCSSPLGLGVRAGSRVTTSFGPRLGGSLVSLAAASNC
jgi:hypothetical protein